MADDIEIDTGDLERRMERLESFTDVRRIQQHADEAGLVVSDRADPSTTGPASIETSPKPSAPNAVRSLSDASSSMRLYRWPRASRPNGA